MILSAHQPAYLPWLGYFDKIIQSDVFVFLDSVQFEKNSFTNRNKIKTGQAPIWLTVPVRLDSHLDCTLLDIQIDPTQDWKDKHLKSIYFNYKKAPRFEENYAKLEKLYGVGEPGLAELCWNHLQFWLRELGIQRKIVRSSELPVKSKKSLLVLDLCKHLGANRYLSGSLGKDYLDLESFRAAGIEVGFQQYLHPTYPQLYGEFVPNMGIVDFWMNSDQFELIAGKRVFS